MRILIVSQYYYPEQFQINEIAPELVRRGHQVTVVCGMPNYPKGVYYQGYENNKKCIEEIDGVKVVRCPQKARGNNPVSLLMNYSSFVRSANKEINSLECEFDVVFTYQLSPITSSLPAIVYKKKHNVPVLLYCLDIWPESAKSTLRGPLSLMYGLVRKISRKVYQNCDKILVTSRPFIDYIHSVNDVPVDRFAYQPQHADSSFLSQDLEAEDNGVADFMFAGNIGKGQHLETLVDAAIALGRRSDYKIHIVGDGSRKTAIESLVRDAGLADNFVFYGNQKRADMPLFYKKADALLLLLRQVNSVGLTMPGKLQVYMTLHKPILGAINGAAKEVIEEARCGRCVAAQDADALAGIMRHFIEHPKDYSHCGACAEKFFLDHFTLDKYTDTLETELVKLVKNNENNRKN